eukprot:COSAG04_NODE_1806_length_5533_cov_96.641884_6_plen_515_part_00
METAPILDTDEVHLRLPAASGGGALGEVPVASAPTPSKIGFINVVAKTLTGQAFHLQARQTDTIWSVKAEINRQGRIPPARQRIVLGGDDLADERSLIDCGVVDGTTLSLVMKLEEQPVLDAALAAKMEAHGLTEAEQLQLHGEGVVDVETFASLRDADFETSAIDIDARRQEKLHRDRAAARARYEQAFAQKAAEHATASEEQVQGFLDQAGLSAQGREAVRGLRDLEALRQLDLASMAELGLNIVDRRKLDELRTSDEVRRAQAPVLEEVMLEEVMTEPERARREAAAEGLRPAVRQRVRDALSTEARAALDEQLREVVGPSYHGGTGDVAAIERLAAEGAIPSRDLTLSAARKGHSGAVSALVRLGADLDTREGPLHDGWTALMFAALNGRVEMARALLAGGADRTLRFTGGHPHFPYQYTGKTALEMAEFVERYHTEEQKQGKAEVAALLREPERASMRQARETYREARQRQAERDRQMQETEERQRRERQRREAEEARRKAEGCCCVIA